MPLTKVSYQQPTFKDGVMCEFKDTRIEIRYGDRGCAIAILPEDGQEINKLLRLLQIGGFSSEQLAQWCPGIQEQIPELLSEFEERGLLADKQRQINPQGVTGQQFYRELCRFVVRFKQKFPPSPFSLKMADGTLSRNQVIGYALESYHITHLCPRLLAPSLAHHESPTTQKHLQEFFTSELHHDRLLEKSLKSVGIAGEQLKQMQPLPMTFAICSALGVFANQHPLSFKAALMLFEEDDHHFQEIFKQHCQTLKLPSEFYQPILLHSRINEDGAHDQITADLLIEVPYVSLEEQLVVKKNMAILMESMVLRTHEILDYYGNPNNPLPRCFD
ncbi:MAG: iron-containing redox enzyme family protein [Calothrix sp. MO_167.B12]|nr:iron-containing redox enzyme family protein [Calothrix sp. MO_167.B12]